MQRQVERTSEELIELEHKNDAVFLAARCNEVFSQSEELAQDVKIAVCESHINTLQKLWLPSEYIELQADAYRQADDLFVHRRSEEAQEIIYTFEQFLINDPIARQVRLDATKGLRDAINPVYRDEFDALTGYEEEAVETKTILSRSIQSARSIGAIAARSVVGLRQSFAK